MVSKRHKQRTYARNRIFSRRGNEKFEPDSQYLLKLVAVMILGMVWLRFKTPLQMDMITFTALPVGLLVGLLLVYWLERRPSDRRIWYAILLISAIFSYFLPAGIIL